MKLSLPKFRPREAQIWFRDWAASKDEPLLELEVTRGTFWTPGFLALVAAGVSDRNERGLTTRLHFEDGGGDALRYLQRIDFFRSLGIQAAEDFARRDPKGRFVPLKRVTTVQVARELAEETADVLEANLPSLSSSVSRAARFVLEELGANIAQHSERPSTGFGLAQAYPRSDRIEIAFADAGIGFRRSLERNPEFEGRITDDGEALLLAVEKQVSRHGTGNIGMGLHLLCHLADRLGGDVWIASGDALLHRGSSVGGHRTNVVKTGAAWNGAWLCLDTPVLTATDPAGS